ncbi:Wadjet anti-phage system protein JetD domain-containing protein [Ureibacillus sp. MALMAid1270]|uniref:Wadjet anti-phage system protein JetD domain-containing protein n=1 Tax=Ureibacillus sp. MALMAid1270 TaxID=3411629 RepID=UPI003BA4B764
MELIDHLFTFSKTYITLNDLEKMGPNYQTYEQFSTAILRLEEQGILQAVKSAGCNGKTPSLAYKYRIHYSKLKKDVHKDIEKFSLSIHPALKLDDYFRSLPQKWEADKPYIEKIDKYIKTYGLPTNEVPAPERSLALVGDEKWIQEKNGQKLLESIKIWDQLKIVPVHDPLSFAINPSLINNQIHYHLIVENKTTFDGLIGKITDTPFTTLIYGQGYKITKSIEHFKKQFPVPTASHLFYYFGDIDWEGIKIWHLLTQKIDAIPALYFYRAVLKKQAIPVRTNQVKNETANERFYSYFNDHEKRELQTILTNNYYYPQEVLSSSELKQIWSESDWTSRLSKL